MKPSRARILLVRDSFPYLGGSSTYLYLLFEILQKRFPNTEWWSIIPSSVQKLGKRHYGPHWLNPKKFKNVRTFVLNGKRGLTQIRQALREKPVAAILSKSRKTTALMKALEPTVPVWHLTSTSSIIKQAIGKGKVASMESAVGHLKTNGLLKLRSSEELAAIRAADRILCHTKSMRFWYHNFYPEYRDKLEEEIFWDFPVLEKEFRHVRVNNPWKSRPIDLLFVASDWGRPEKNFPLLKKLCQTFPEKKIMVVGFLPETLPSSVIAFETMSQEEVVEAMVQAKVVVCPSRYDEAPNVLFEAAIAGCNIVCSKNCGNYQLTHSSLVALLELPDFTRKIRKALKAKLSSNQEEFSKTDLPRWINRQLLKP